MSKITKKQKKLQELLADFQQPVSGREALVKLQEISKEVGIKTPGKGVCIALPISDSEGLGKYE